MKTRVYFDGGNDGSNPGPMKTSVVIEQPDAKPIVITNSYKQSGSNNQSEWLAAYTALWECDRRNIWDFELFGDSQMVINVINGKWNQKNKNLKIISDEFFQQLKHMKIKRLKSTWVPREHNPAGWAISNKFYERNQLNEYYQLDLVS